jgi:NAD(P)-dependent dehydrogenase (short-subunit alcohol dehydrogenase family)
MITTNNTDNKTIKSIWLVGASTGIGASLVKAFDDVDTQIFVSARNVSKINTLFLECAARIIPVELDVVDEASVNAAISKVLSHTAHLDTVIINAGTCEYIDSKEIDIASVKRVMDTNFYGALNIINASLPLIRAAKNTRELAPQLVLVSSSVSYQALPRAGAYGASKAAIRYMMECLKFDLQHEGIDIRVVSPGFVKTPLTDKNDFPMPFRISADEAAQRIVKGLKGNAFDIHFPKRFTYILKALSCLPDRLRFSLIGKSSRHLDDFPEFKN